MLRLFLCAALPRASATTGTDVSAVQAALLETASWAIECLGRLLRHSSPSTQAQAVFAIADSGLFQAFVDACVTLALPAACLLQYFPTLADATNVNDVVGEGSAFTGTVIVPLVVLYLC